MKEKVSIIVPVYNSGIYIRKCIDSVLHQSYQNFELLLIDDGSTDNSAEICDGYLKQDSRVRVIHKQNGGVSSTRNLGLKYSKGEYIIFIDSDDYVSPKYVENLLSEVRGRSGYGLVLEGYILDNNGEQIPIVFQRTIYDNIAEAIEKSNLSKKGFACGKIYSAELIRKEKLKFNERVSYSEDMLFMLSYLLFCDWVIVSDQVGYYYVKHGNESLSSRYFNHTNELECYADFRKSMDLIQRRYKIDDSYMPRTISWLTFFLIRSITSLYRPGISMKLRKDRLFFLNKTLTDSQRLLLSKTKDSFSGLSRLICFFISVKKYKILDIILQSFFAVRYSSLMKKIRGL